MISRDSTLVNLTNPESRISNPDRLHRLWAALLLALWSVIAQPVSAANAARPAYLRIDLASGRVLESENTGAFRASILPGSVVKVATLIGALESGTIDAGTRLLCPGFADVEGKRLACSHPSLRRPMSPAEALAHSCNHFFATVARRLPRGAFNDALVGLGLPAVGSDVPLTRATLGLSGITVAPRALLEMLARATDRARGLQIRDETRAIVLEGLRGCARYGTASALGDAGVDALAKTGTTTGFAGGQLGIVVALIPSTAPKTGLIVLAPGAAGRNAAEIAAGILKRAPPAPALSVRPRPSAIALGVANQRGGYQIVRVDLEEYVARVLAGEAPRAPAAALEALAIAARTYAAANRGRHKRHGFDLCDLTHCELARSSTPATRTAAAATAGRILLFEGEAAPVFFSAACGGRTEDIRMVWPDPRRPAGYPYLASRKDSFCARDTRRWTSEIDADRLVRALRTTGRRGDSLRELRISRRTPSGRVAELRADGMTPREISGQDFRTAVGSVLGWQLVKSTAFDVHRTARGYRFEGKGSGHGVGLCLAGSIAMADAGRTAVEILEAYYPGLTITAGVAGAPSPTFDPGQTRLLLAFGSIEEQERHDTELQVREALAALVGDTAVPAPPQIRLRFHPTTESYRRSTGRGWWTSAATQDESIELQPVAILRTRGVLASTLRHELAHVLIDPSLKGRPLWVREGAATHFAKEKERLGAGGENDLRCPTDHELLSASSAEAFRAAYGRAYACFTRQLARGVRWQDVR